MKVEDVLPPLILTFTEEVFYKKLSPNDCGLNFMLCFTGLANTNTWAEVRSPERDDPFMRFHFSVAFFSARACTAAAAFCFHGARVTGSGRGWQSTPANSNT
jgi:hypothetical protein